MNSIFNFPYTRVKTQRQISNKSGFSSFCMQALHMIPTTFQAIDSLLANVSDHSQDVLISKIQYNFATLEVI